MSEDGVSEPWSGLWTEEQSAASARCGSWRCLFPGAAGSAVRVQRQAVPCRSGLCQRLPRPKMETRGCGPSLSLSLSCGFLLQSEQQQQQQAAEEMHRQERKALRRPAGHLKSRRKRGRPFP